MLKNNIYSSIFIVNCIMILHLFTLIELTYAQEERWTHYGIRPLSMGNAFVAVAVDFNALHYNPAGLAKLKTWSLEILNPYIEISKSVVSIYQDISDLTSGSSRDTSAVLDILETYTGKTNHIGLGLRPYLLLPKFGLGIATDLDSSVSFHRYPSIYLHFGAIITMPIGYAISLLDDRLQLGATIKFIGKNRIEHEFSIQDLEVFAKNEQDSNTNESSKLDDFYKSGTRQALDVGLLCTPIKPMEPTLGISIANAIGTPYTKVKIANTTSPSKPDAEIPSINVGLSLKPWQTKWSYLLTALDIHEINKPYSFSKKFNIGAEWGFGSILKIGAGLHQGYFSAGFQIDAILLKLRFVTYAEEMGPASGTCADRRYALQLKLLI